MPHQKAVIAWEGYMRESEHTAASTIRRRLAALSSLYKHLVRHDHAARNPVGEVEQPAINRDEGSTLAFSKPEARKLLDAPAEDTVAGLRDRAILSVGLQVGLRRAEIAALTVGDLHQNEERFSLTAAEPTYRIFAERLVRCAAKRKTLFIMTRKLITTTRNTR
jgi:site-specific recombinase XerD